MGQRVVFACSGGEKLQQRGRHQGRKKPIHAQVIGVALEEGSCRPGSNEIVSATPKTSTPLGIPPFPNIFVQPCSSC